MSSDPAKTVSTRNGLEFPFVQPTVEGTKPVPELVICPEPSASPHHSVLEPGRRPPRVLLVEDDAIDRDAIERAFRRISKPVELRSVTDGHEALDFLLRRGVYDTRWAGWHPDILLLDLMMPRITGTDVLQAIRLDSRLDDLVVLVLTGRDDRKTIRELYRLGANGYLVKPDSMSGFNELAAKLQTFWLDGDNIKLPR